MLKKFLKEAVANISGKNSDEIVDLLFNKQYVNEFLIAKKMDITINQTRNILYKLQDKGVISSTRKKDKKKGWYTYLWKLDSIKLLEFLRRSYIKKIEQIENQIKSRESKEFYICKRCNIEFHEQNALIHDFSCPECGEVLEIKDNTELLKQLNRNLNKFKEILGNINAEIEKEKEKLMKKAKREAEKIAKEKKKTAAKKKASKKKTVKLKSKKASKKSAKKKTTKKKVSKKKTLKKTKAKSKKRK